MRECGECTACCEGWVASKSLDMFAGRPCQHCRSSGCNIYEERPQDPCRTFRCGWLDNESEFPDDMRPDLAGVIVLNSRPWYEWDVLRAAPVGQAIPPQTLERLRLYAQQKGLPLVFFDREVVEGQFTKAEEVKAFGSPAFARAVENRLLPNDFIKFE